MNLNRIDCDVLIKFLKNFINLLACKAILFLVIISFSSTSFGQDIEGITEFFTFYPNKESVKKDSTLYLSKFIVAPVVTYSPETNLTFGTGAKYLFKFNGSGEETRVSNMPMSLSYTLNNQFIVYSGFEIFTNQEKWVIEGNLLFQNYPRLYYGIGKETSKKDVEQYNYYQVLIEPIFLKQLFARYLFIGAGIRYNAIFNVEAESGNTLNNERPIGFNGSTSVGLEAAVLYDSRNNILNAKDGWYLEATYGFYKKMFGSTHEFELTRFDIRHFRKLWNKKNDVLAFQLFGRFSHGNVPFNELALFGGDDILRGYREGRYIDRHLIAGQTEYRKTFGNSRWGAVAFLGAGDVYANLNEFKLGNFRPNYGAGIRFMLDRSENLNIRFDYGFGEDSNYFYLSISEAF